MIHHNKLHMTETKPKNYLLKRGIIWQIDYTRDPLSPVLYIAFSIRNETNLGHVNEIVLLLVIV